MKFEYYVVIARSELCDEATQVLGWFMALVKYLSKLRLLRRNHAAIRGPLLAMTNKKGASYV
jgi:hypothetical protein